MTYVVFLTSGFITPRGALHNVLLPGPLSVCFESIVKAFGFPVKRNRYNRRFLSRLPPAWSSHTCLDPGQPLGNHGGSPRELQKLALMSPSC